MTNDPTPGPQRATPASVELPEITRDSLIADLEVLWKANEEFRAKHGCEGEAPPMGFRIDTGKETLRRMAQGHTVAISRRYLRAIIHWLKATDADQKNREATVSRINAIPTADLDMLCVQPQPDCEGAEHPYRSGFWMREGGNWRIVVGTMVSCHPDYCGFRGDEFVSGFTDNTFCEVGDVLPRGQWQMVAQLPSRCEGCGLEETHKMCPAHGTPAYMNKEHWGWGSVYGLFKLKSEMKDQRIAELEQAIAQERHQAKVYRLEMVKAQEEVKTHLRLIAGLVEALHE